MTIITVVSLLDSKSTIFKGEKMSLIFNRGHPNWHEKFAVIDPNSRQISAQ